ncbi:membrane protease subunit (stomatin/prohibitin family) [Amycolatopsis sulphurea]|uniref:Membrane protease subunit (Stomatin/prohibitin family) n=1 Tax=Amycolatopsis sulphurea TaxID=76022 RepID=A0A2A9F6R0_9PSEU|nr:SPFH domain-containing protein [Amycolatopsis sulphurea]PFG46451.1 membrane protease subunit (stomatin/prohibitin family) [Amycolatopsis sulphurea]
MGIFDKIRGEFIDIIEWTDDSRDTIVWRFPRHENEIKMGAKLTVRESQAAVFVNEGQVADAYPPGMYTLQTQNMPVLSTLKGWKYGFNSPFKAEVYFVNTRQFTDLKWGTQNPIILRDPEFGMVRLRAFGGYAVRVVEPVALLKELAGTDPRFRTEEVSEYLRQLIIGKLGPAIAGAGVPMLDLVTQQDQLGGAIANALNLELRANGIEISKFVIENISVPPEVEAAMDKRTQMGVVGNLDQYTQFQSANAIEAAAQNQGGAGEGLGIGLGMALGQRVAGPQGQQQYQQPQYQQQQYQQPPTGPQYQQQPPAAPQYQQAPPGPPPLPQAEQWFLGAGGQQLGPFDRAQLGQQVGAGTLTRETLVWKNGMAAWTPAAQVPEVAALLGATPPPLPPQS